MKYAQFNVSWWNYAINEYRSNAEWNIKDTIHSNDVCLATAKYMYFTAFELVSVTAIEILNLFFPTLKEDIPVGKTTDDVFLWAAPHFIKHTHNGPKYAKNPI